MKPTHYKVITISLYNEDLAQLDKMVRALKKRGHTRANRSAVLRAVLNLATIKTLAKTGVGRG